VADRTLDMTLPAAKATARAVRSRIRCWLEELRWPVDPLDDVEYAVSEAVSNAAEHAYPSGADGAEITVVAGVEELPDGRRRLRVRVRDCGRWRPVPADSEGRRRGIPLMESLMDQVVIDAGGDGTQVTLVTPAVHAAVPGGRNAAGA
jgi:anti-sigma regulatory factor (Ser/Thr protein kinase)